MVLFITIHREQAEYLKSLITKDMPIIARLTSGERRKPDGTRFHIGGVDISFIKDNKVDACACISVVEWPNLKVTNYFLFMFFKKYLL